jgi:hypothetical protein
MRLEMSATLVFPGDAASLREEGVGHGNGSGAATRFGDLAVPGSCVAVGSAGKRHRQLRT